MTKQRFLPISPPHEAIFSGPSAWLASDLSSEKEYIYDLESNPKLEIEHLLSSITAGEIIKTSNIPLLRSSLIDILRRVLSGRGFVVLRGIPVGSDISLDLCSNLISTLGSMIGSILPQDKAGTLAFPVRNEGYNREQLFQATAIRGASTSGSLTPHTDSAPLFGGSAPDVIFLFALSTSLSGGLSTVASAQTIH